MTREERMAVIRRVADKAHGQVPVVAGTGGNNTREVIEEARCARDNGADVQLCVTPYYNKTTQAGLIAHYHAIADSGRAARDGLQRARPYGAEHCACHAAGHLPARKRHCGKGGQSRRGPGH